MEITEKVEYFKNELAYILNPTVKEFATKAVGFLPDYFFAIPASSTGQYHPAYSLGEGGLARHTRAAIRIAIELNRMDDYKFTPDEIDLSIAALLVHDGWKSGLVKETYTRADHPLIAEAELRKNESLNTMLPPEQFSVFLGLIARHMGQWNKDYKTGQEIMNKPEMPLEKFVHLCDYLASRKCLIMAFDVGVVRERQSAI
jgi:hypothetical protein